MTTPASTGKDPEEPESATEWAPPDAPPPADAGPPPTEMTPPGSPPGEPAPDPPPHPDAAAPAGPGTGTFPDASSPAAPAPFWPRTNRLAIAALVTGLLGLVVVAVGLAIAALVRAGRRGEPGKGLAIGALVASAVWTVVGAIVLVIAANSLLTVERDESGAATREGLITAQSMRVGDCFTGFQGELVDQLVTVLPCTHRHQGEVTAKARLSGDVFPGNTKFVEQANESCFLETEQVFKSRLAARLEPVTLIPSDFSWSSGDREVLCLTIHTGPGTITAPLTETLDPSLRLWHELTVGECLGKWNDDAWAQRVIPCTDPHWRQVYATFKLKGGPYQGDRATHQRAERGCDSRFMGVYPEDRAPDLYSWLYPDQVEWENGLRTVICSGMSEDRPMKKPLLPD